MRVNMTVTTDDDDVRRIFEPSCFQNGARLKGIQDVQEAGIEACVTMTPAAACQQAGVVRLDSPADRGAELHRAAVPIQLG